MKHVNPAKSSLLKDRISELFSDLHPEFDVAGSEQSISQLPSDQQETLSSSVVIPLPDNSERENASIATLPMQSFQMEIDAPANHADKAFRNSPGLIGVIVQEQGKIHGIVSRRKFYETMGKPFASKTGREC